MNGILFSVGFVSLFLIGVVESTGKLTIKLYSYDNVQGTTYDGECCDSDVKKCLLDKCDLKFDICVGKHIDGSYDCTYGTKQVISPTDMNSIEFTDVFNFAITNSLKEDLYIRVNVTDQDSEEATDLVDAFHFKYSRTAFFNSSLAEYMDYFIRGERKNNPTRLNFSLASYCDQNYYGEDCSINCVPEDFGCNGHYRCRADGAKICLPGWKGPNCDIQIPGGEGDCSFYKDSNELLPSLWMGSYACPDGISHIIQVNVTQRKVGSIEMTAVLTFEGISTIATGTFGHRSLNIQSKDNNTSVILYGTQPANNLTTMTGDLTKDGKSCPLTLNMQKSYFNYCGSGTCVRYGQQKDEYYCCCANSNKASVTCETTTTAGVTSPTTTSTTATPKTTTEKPTTQKPTTQRPTTQKPTTESTTPETTTTSTTTTTQPTSPETTISTPKPTTEQPTTESTTKSTTTKATTMPDTTEATTVTTKQSTTPPSTTTTTKVASSPSTVVTTSKPVTPSTSPVQVLEDSFFINLLDNEIDSPVISAIEDAYVEANKDKNLQRKNIEFPDSILRSKYVYEKRKHRGELLSLVKYNISISGVSATIKVPAKHDIQIQVMKQYTDNVRVYEVSNNLLFPEEFSFQLNVYGPGPGDNEMTLWEKVILDVYNAESNCSSQACQLNSVSIKCTDEYMDYEGREVTRLYIYIFTGILAHPPTNAGPYIRALQNHSAIKATFFSGSLDLHNLLWYRHHYDLFIEGSVDQRDLPEFVRRLQNAWYSAEPGYYCTLCNASIHRIEKYVGENGESLTAIVYFFKVREIFSMPIMDEKYNYIQYIKLDKLTDVNGNQYRLYNGTKKYRYEHAYNLLIDGQIDPTDRSQFTAALKQAWLDYNASLTSITPSYLMEEYVSSTGDLVTNIVCFISLGDLDMDARLIPAPTMTWLHLWRMNQSNLVFTRAGGQAYQIYTKFSLSQLHLRTDLFSMYFEGYIKVENWIEIQKSLQNAWNSTNFSGKNISVQILRSSTYSVYFKRETVTMLWYSLRVDGKLVSPFTVLYSQRTLVYNISMVSLASRFPVYVLKDRLLDRGNQFTLYFTTKINYLDFDLGLKTQLLDVIKRKWRDSGNYKNLDLYIDFQEKVYGTDSMVLWKLVFYLTSNQREIHSQFVSSITHQLFQSEEIKGISGQLYHLYKGQMSSTWLSYNSHFSLTFGSEVSRLDWLKVKQTLSSQWCRNRFVCGNGQDVSITIKEQEQYWNDISRQWNWQLVYFVHYKNHLISSQSHSSIDTNKLNFSWTNVYNGTYHLVKASSGWWKFSRSFHLWTEEHLTINTEAMDKIRLVLLQAWYKMNVRSDLKTCNCVSIHILPQQRYYAGNGKSLWKLTYFILYKGKVVMDAHLWPALNTALIDWSTVTSQEVKVKTDIDLYYYLYMLKFSLNHKLSISEYGKVEKALTQEYTIKHPECGCHVSIAHQEEVIDSQGKSSWIVYYHLVKNGTYQNPSSYTPINWGLFSSKHNFTSWDGHKLDFSWSRYGNHKFVGYSQSGGLFLQTWVPPSLYGNFAAWLEWYYQRYFKDSTVHVEMTNTTREYKKTDGSSVWHLPFILKVNGSIVTPPSINSTTFETTFNTTSQWKQKFTLVHTDEVTDKHKVFSILFNHKVSEPAKEEIKKAIIATFVQQHPGVNSSLLNLTFGSQQETFSSKDNKTTGKSSSWELSYTISVGGSTVDSRSTTSLNTSLLTSNLNVTGPNNVKYRVITNTEAHTYIAASRVSSLYVKSFVSVEDIKKMEEKIAIAWKQQYNISEEVKVTFIRQKQYMNNNGEAVWKWDYTLSLNSSHLVRAEIPPVDHTHLQGTVGSLVSVTGRKYQLVQSSVNFLDYRMHFPLYLTSKMAKENKDDFKKSLEEAWAKKGLGAVSVQIVTQEEIIDKTTGVSSWKLVYFLKHKSSNAVVDSRVTENINATYLFPVVGPRGVYRYRTHLDVSQHLSKSMSKYITINTKLDIKGRATLGRAVTEVLKSSITETSLKSSISVEIAGQEEYFTKQNGRAWKILYFVRLGGDYVPATSLVSIDQNRLVALLSNFTTSHNQRIQLIKEIDLQHSYRNAFSVYFTSKVAVAHFLRIQQSIVKTWEKSTVYTQCNCLGIDNITENHQEEVINSHGVSYWKLNYFLKRSNGSVVESMTHIPLDLDEFSKALTNVTNVKGKPYQVKVVTGTVVRSRMMFSFHMTTEIGYMHREKFQSSIKAAWIRMQPDTLKAGEISVRIYRNTRFVDILKRNAVWQVDYVIEKSSSKVDPLELPPLPIAELQKNLTFHNPRGVLYQVVDTPTGLVDYRMHFGLFVSVEIKSTDFVHFSSALEHYWASKDGYRNSSAAVYFQERFVNSYGKMLWKLVIFMKKGVAYLDSRTSESVNTTHLQGSITAVDSRGHKYQLVNDRSNTLRRYDAGFSFLLSRTVLRSDLIHVSNAIKETWTLTEVGLKNITVEVISQENYYTSKMGLTSKILYFLSVDGSWVDSGMLGNVNATILQQKLTSLSTSHKYELVVVTKEDLYRYEWLFTLDLLVPLLSVDYRKMESQLAAAWMADNSTNFRNLTIKILHQESLISGQGVPVYRILYFMNGDSKVQRATQRRALSSSMLTRNVTLQKPGASYKYIDKLYGGGSDLFRYTDLFSLHFRDRVANYSLLESQIKEAWNSSVNVEGEKIAKVSIVGQEKILLKNGDSAFQLLYHVESRNQDYTINRPLILGPSHDALVKHVKVEGPTGVAKRVLNVTEGFRMSQVFSVVVNRQVFMSDQSKFESSLLHSLKSQWSDVSSELSFTVRSKERVVDKSSRKILWRYSYVVTSNGHALDVSRHYGVSSTTLTSNLNFTSPSKGNYAAVNTEVGSYKEMFSLQVENIQSTLKTQKILEELRKIWTGNVHVAGNLLREEYLSIEGAPVTKLSYFVEKSSGLPVYPSVTKPPVYDSLATSVGVRLFTGKSSLRYSDCFRLYVGLPQWTVDRSSVKKALTQVWTTHSPATKNITINLINGMDAFVGSYGLRLSALLYTISYQSAGQTRVMTPDITIHPESEKVQTALSSQKSKLTIYRSTPLRTRSLFQVSLIHKRNVTMSVSHVQRLSVMIKGAWNSMVQNKVETVIVYTQAYRTLNGRSQITRLYYHVQQNNQTVEPWEDKVQPAKFHENLAKLLQNDSSLGDDFMMSSQAETKVYTLFVQGHQKDFSDIRTAIQRSWQSSITGSVVVTTHGAHKYVSDEWRDVTKLSYTVTVNGSSPEILKVSPPYFEMMEAELKKVNKAQCPCYAKKAQKEYLLGTKTSIKVNKVQEALMSAWTSKNPGIQGQKLTVRIKDVTSRQKREKDSATIKTKLVGKDNKEITPVHYMVAMDGHDPDPTFVDTPTSNDLAQPLNQAGAPPCGCSPKLEGSFQLKGATNPSDKGKITDAIADAFAKENKDVNKKDIKADAKLNNTKSNGEDVTVVDYTVQRSDDEAVENLRSPKRVDLERSLSTVGKTLYSKAPAPPPEEEDDKIKLAVYIAVGVVAFIILVMIICYVAYIRSRRRKKGNLLKREQTVKENNFFDTEHFSEPAASHMYENPQYEPSPVKQDLRNV
ncbi:uncharacterized protein LOC128166095 isoform X1 [Crassostrea angulata]|uniref:uncharacterized protein LOC128166095 isoform X1 n=1 Tax=Magallana angulata TaxID=2784310 RepID=UPI0022B0EA83|nr:uncharacterized protein LOC128166095 isoform X1 [Crassostrea angulata]